MPINWRVAAIVVVVTAAVIVVVFFLLGVLKSETSELTH